MSGSPRFPRPEEWQRIKTLFNELLDKSPSEQGVALASLDESESSIAKELRNLLRAHALPDDSSMGALEFSTNPSADKLEGLHFGTYKAQELLPSGGMGVVYRCYSEELNKHAAIKVPRSNNGAAREQFNEERRMLGALTHAGIPHLYEAGILVDGTPWIAMEFVLGERLSTYVWSRRLPLRTVLQIFGQLCDAVQYLHQQGTVHRDLKPSNVLVTDDGTVKLLDLGIAKRIEAFRSDDTLSKTLQMSMPYASPQQLRLAHVGVSADVYSLGVILHELISGRRPYALNALDSTSWFPTIVAAHPPRIRNAIREQLVENAARTTNASATEVPAVPVSERDLSADEWRDVDALLAKALEPEEADRYATVAEFSADIKRLLSRQPLKARPAGALYKTRKFARRRWKELGIATVMTAALSVLMLSVSNGRTARRDAEVAQAATTRVRQFLDDLFLGAQHSTLAPDSIRATTLVQNGIREARALRHDPALRVDMLETLGTLSEHLGQIVAADSLYREAAASADALYGTDHPESVRPRIRMARLFSANNKSDSAVSLLQEMERLAEGGRYGDSPVVAEVHLALGTVLRLGARIPEAVQQLERAVQLRRAADSTSREYAEALRELGNAYGNNAQLERADSVWQVALPIVKNVFGERHPDVGFLLANLGNSASQRGQLVQAERYQREAASITEGWYGKSSYLTGAVNGVLAQTLTRLERFEEAATLIRSTIQSFNTATDVGPNAPVTFISHNTLATILAGMHKNNEAIREYEMALNGMRATAGPAHPNTLVIAANLGVLLMKSGLADSADALFRGTLKLASDRFGANHPTVAGIRVKYSEGMVSGKRYAEAIPLAIAGLRILDSATAPSSPMSRLARQTLLKAYTAIGDTLGAARVKQELGSATAPRAKAAADPTKKSP